jgi:hypothetical protein
LVSPLARREHFAVGAWHGVKRGPACEDALPVRPLVRLSCRALSLGDGDGDGWVGGGDEGWWWWWRKVMKVGGDGEWWMVIRQESKREGKGGAGGALKRRFQRPS